MPPYLADVAELIPGLAHPLLARRVDPVLHLSQASLDVLPVAEGAALPPQQQLVEELHIHEAEQLLEQLADEEGGDKGALQGLQQAVEDLQDVPPVRAQHGSRVPAAGPCTMHFLLSHTKQELPDPAALTSCYISTIA